MILYILYLYPLVSYYLPIQDGLVSRLDSVYGQYLPSVDQEEQALDPAQFSEQEHHLNINVSRYHINDRNEFWKK